MPSPNWPSSRRHDCHCEERSDEAIQRVALDLDCFASLAVTVDVRIDRFLFFVRLVKSRTIAQHVIDEGHVRVDGRRVGKSSEEVRVGSVVALPLRGEVRILRVLGLPARRGPAAEAHACYEELTEANPRPSE